LAFGLVPSDGAAFRTFVAAESRRTRFELEVLAVFRRVASVLAVLDDVGFAAARSTADLDPVDEDCRLRSDVTVRRLARERDVPTPAPALCARPRLPAPPVAFCIALSRLGLELVPVAVTAVLFAVSADLDRALEGAALPGTAFLAATGFRPPLAAWRLDGFAGLSSALFVIGLPCLPHVFFTSARRLGRACTDAVFRCSNARSHVPVDLSKAEHKILKHERATVLRLARKRSGPDLRQSVSRHTVEVSRSLNPVQLRLRALREINPLECRCRG
jgi:hypothetical protein